MDSVDHNSLCNDHCESVHESGKYCEALLQHKGEHMWFVMKLCSSSYFSFFNSSYQSMNSTHIKCTVYAILESTGVLLSVQLNGCDY